MVRKEQSAGNDTQCCCRCERKPKRRDPASTCKAGSNGRALCQPELWGALRIRTAGISKVLNPALVVFLNFPIHILVLHLRDRISLRKKKAATCYTMKQKFHPGHAGKCQRSQTQLQPTETDDLCLRDPCVRFHAVRHRAHAFCPRSCSRTAVTARERCDFTVPTFIPSACAISSMLISSEKRNTKTSRCCGAI